MYSGFPKLEFQRLDDQLQTGWRPLDAYQGADIAQTTKNPQDIRNWNFSDLMANTLPTSLN
jgi:hypothetical protein